MKLDAFANGFCPSTEVKGWWHNHDGQKQVREWIEAGYLREPGTTSPSALMGKLWLTDKGREKAGIKPAVIEKPVVERTKSLFGDE